MNRRSIGQATVSPTRTLNKQASTVAVARGAAPVPSAMSSNIKVCVRVRPFVPREKGETACVAMPNETQVVLVDRHGHQSSHEYDRAYWSHKTADRNFATQELLMEEQGRDIVENAKNGFNNCLLAYGQTGSGKTYSVLGNMETDDRGLLPRIVQELYQEIEESQRHGVEYKCNVSYLEIYNERIHDLLVPVNQRADKKLEVRSHPKFGLFVPGLTENLVRRYHDVKALLDFGVKARSVASTNMNVGSSRSHCIFIFQMEKHSNINGRKSQLRAKVNLVDLAGSERQGKAGTSGDRLKEGSMINKSLSSLAKVILELSKPSKDKAQDHVNFRDSKLTHLLQESLSGNSKTVLVAALSPAMSNYDETLSTLRFASNCKKITLKAIKNEINNDAIMQQLKREINQMKEAGAAHDPALTERLKESEDIRKKLEEDQKKTVEEFAKLDEMRESALADMGLSIGEISSGFKVDPNMPQLVNLSDDPALAGTLIYFLPESEEIVVGSADECTIVLGGLGIQKYMCILRNHDNRSITMESLDPDGNEITKKNTRKSIEMVGSSARKNGRILVNGRRADNPQALRHMDRLILGHACCFRISIPLMAGSTKRGPVDGLDLHDALAEVMNEDCPEYAECQAMIGSIQDRIGRQDAEEFLELFARTLPFVQEANQITNELRPDDEFRYQVEVCSDVMTFTSDQPELIVRFYKGQPDGTEVVVDIYELEQFEERLAHMRELYENHGDKSRRRNAIEEHDFRDPWVYDTYQEFIRLKAQLAARNDYITKLVANETRRGASVPPDDYDAGSGLNPMTRAPLMSLSVGDEVSPASSPRVVYPTSRKRWGVGEGKAWGRPTPNAPAYRGVDSRCVESPTNRGSRIPSRPETPTGSPRAQSNGRRAGFY